MKEISLPCLYCGKPVSITETHVACDNELCQDKEASAYDDFEG